MATPLISRSAIEDIVRKIVAERLGKAAGPGSVPGAAPALVVYASARHMHVSREHLDQKFQTYAVSFVYKVGNHQIGARYDMFNYNSGNDYYGAGNPYLPTTGANAGGDFSPKYTETTLGYNYLFVPNKYTYGKLKVDYILRSKNFLASNAALGQTGAQGGDSLVMSVMVGF